MLHIVISVNINLYVIVNNVLQIKTAAALIIIEYKYNQNYSSEYVMVYAW
jgi:hypothetical protein